MKISAADALLASMQGMLGTFQSDLGKVCMCYVYLHW